MNKPRIFALVPAAGQSRRMGRPKLLLPLGDRTVLRRVVDAFKQAGVATVLVVVGPDMPALAHEAEQAGASVLRLDTATADMRATVECGLAWLEAHHQPVPEDAWLLAPADHPTLDAAVIGQLVQARAAHAGLSIFLPTFQDRRGHPALIGWAHVPAIRRLPAGAGLNQYLRGQAAQTFLLPVTSESILADLDTPADYARLCERPW
jgi:molybdenum cofactor cytidylyltransferase